MQSLHQASLVCELENVAMHVGEVEIPNFHWSGPASGERLEVGPHHDLATLDGVVAVDEVHGEPLLHSMTLEELGEFIEVMDGSVGLLQGLRKAVPAFWVGHHQHRT